MDSTDKKTPRLKAVKQIALFLIFLLPTAYIAFQLFLILVNRPYTTQTAIKYTISDAVTSKAFMDMPQENITYNGGVLSYLKENGEKVSPGNVLAEVFANNEQAQSRALSKQLTKEADLLKSAAASTVGVNIETLLEQKLSKGYALIELLDSKQYSTINHIKSDLQLATNKLQIATKEVSDFNASIDALTSAAAAASDAAGAFETVNAPRVGYFVSAERSMPPVFTSQQLAEITPLELKTANVTIAEDAESNVMGRLIYDYRWKCYMSVNLKQSEKFIEGKEISLKFPEVSDARIPARIEKVETDTANDAAKITITSDYMNKEIISFKGSKAQAIFGDFEGLRLDKSALRILNGEPGVYVKYGNTAEYRKIKILFEDENYILTPLTYEKGVNELKMYDEVIIGGRNIEEGKTM
ncbi:MAG: HlyD family efflux transporter periplasmic adaptor subunit [Oscillospiraceae bacterium]